MELIRFYNVADGIVAGTTGRGVVGNGNSYSGFNICHYVGDKPNHTDACLHDLADILGLPIENIIFPRQIHSDKVVVVSEIADFRNVEADALITTLPDVAVGVNTADCVPVLLADTSNGIVAAIHAGWRGIINGVITKAIALMTESGASLKTINAVIAPAICADCYEVGEDVAGEFVSKGLADCVIRSMARPHIELPKAALIQLVVAGVSAENISVANDCTRCNPQRYFSARRLGIDSGRNFSFIYRKSSSTK